MKPHGSDRKNHAMTLIEAVVVIGIITFLLLMLLPAFLSRSSGGQKISCSNNLKQVGLACKIWAEDNNDKYPMDVSVTNGGTKEFMNTSDAWKAYLVMSNELSTPKTLFCPEDTSHGTISIEWNDALKAKISYFIGLDGTDTNSTALLSGDGNFLLNNAAANHGFVNASTNASLTWDYSRHLTDFRWFKPRIVYGNIGLCDGSVQSLSNVELPQYLHQTGLATNRIFVP